MRVEEEIEFIYLNFSRHSSCKFLFCSTLQSPESLRRYSEVLLVYMDPRKDSNKALNVIKMALNEVRLTVSETVGL